MRASADIQNVGKRPERDAPRRSALIRLITGRRSKYLVLLFWLAVLVLSVGIAGKLGSVQKNDAVSSLPGKAESTQALQQASTFVSPNLIPAVIVYERPGGLTDADKAKAVADAKTFGQRTDLNGQVVGPMYSGDNEAAQVIVPLDLGPDSFSKAAPVVTDIRKVAEKDANGLTVHVAGSAGAAADVSDAVNGLDATLLLATVVVVVIILLFTYRSPVLWLVPIVAAGVALEVAQAAIYVLAKTAHITVTSDGTFILTILVFGAGTDYALLLIARYREELRRHENRHDAMAEALARSSHAILASAATVTIALLCLLFAESNATKGLGPVLAAGIVAALVVMLSMFPAFLLVFGRWIFWPSRPTYGSADTRAVGFWGRIGTAISHRPRITWIVTALVLGAMALGIGQLQANGISANQTFQGYHDSVAGEDSLLKHFAANAGGPVIVIGTAGTASQLHDALAKTSGVDAQTVSEPVVKDGRAYVEAALTDPADSTAAFRTIDHLRATVHAIPGSQAKVGGVSAITLDGQRAAKHDRQLIVPIVLAVVLLILILLLRAVVGALLLTATVVLSFGAALGLSALAFRHLFHFTGADGSFPLFAFVFMVALGVDYNIFLMTRVREETFRHGTRRAAVIGLAATGGVITSAGLVLASTFAVLASLPLTQIVELGFAVAVGILLDTLIVRSVLVTALNLDIGRYIWWPSKLFRRQDEAAPKPRAPLSKARQARGVSAS